LRKIKKGKGTGLTIIAIRFSSMKEVGQADIALAKARRK
jgi:hypothetical protein